MHNTKSMAWQKSYWWLMILGGILIWRVMIGVVVEISPQLLPAQESFVSAGEIFGSDLPVHVKQLAVFDGVHYRNIARYGYQFGLTQAFFPIFPLLIRGFGYLTNLDYLVVGGLISISSLLIGGLFWFKYLQSVGLDRPAKTLLIWLLFPTSFYLAAVYTESLFFMLMGMSFLLMAKKKFILSALVIAVMSATRLIGVLMVLPLIYEYLSTNRSLFAKDQFLSSKSWSLLMRLFILVLISGAGLLAYSYYLYYQFGDPWLFVQVQSQFGAGRSQDLVVYPQVLWRAIKIIWTQRPFDWRYLTSVLEFLAGTLPLLAMYRASKIRKVMGLVVFSLAAFLLPTLTGNFSSMPRYILLCPAMIVGLESWLQPNRRLYTWLTVSTMLLLICTTLFARGYWIG